MRAPPNSCGHHPTASEGNRQPALSPMHTNSPAAITRTSRTPLLGSQMAKPITVQDGLPLMKAYPLTPEWGL
jgi:hypothetical protein